jgi:hypothetical protein
MAKKLYQVCDYTGRVVSEHATRAAAERKAARLNKGISSARRHFVYFTPG